MLSSVESISGRLMGPTGGVEQPGRARAPKRPVNTQVLWNEPLSYTFGPNPLHVGIAGGPRDTRGNHQEPPETGRVSASGRVFCWRNRLWHGASSTNNRRQPQRWNQI
jgi:hypothetical protein